MRSRKDVRFSNRHNQTKLKILKELVHPTVCTTHWMTSDDIADACDITSNNASRQMTKLVKQGYVYRKDIGKKSFRYRHLERMGERVLHKLWVRQWLIDKTGCNELDLNLEHPIPNEVLPFFSEAETAFNAWLHER